MFVCEQCNPNQPSVPLLGYHFYRTLKQLADVTLVTHGRNEASLKTHFPNDNIHFIHECFLSTYWAKIFQSRFWPLHHLFFFPIYEEFNQKVALNFFDKVDDFDIVFAFSPIIPRYPYKIAKYCTKTPFLLGPVNGGLPFPKGYQEIKEAEGERFNFLKKFNFLVPGYSATYRQAKKVLVGSSHTLLELKNLFPETEFSYFSENGVADDFFLNKPKTGQTILFAGRLTPYKGADILIEAFKEIKNGRLIIAGEGPQRPKLEDQIEKYGLKDRVELKGYIPPEKMFELYQEANIFAFPSLREFGGAVVLEAMASSLPCVITDYGGMAEYLPDDAGKKIKLKPRAEFVKELACALQELIDNPRRQEEMGKKGREAAEKFRWINKASALIKIMEELKS
ncbi:MAG: glycosyltransferase family 4 protein [Parachlamydiaceae bacterium]